jgi:meso-butanediol dehydrogenase/(S,S)-butanediol dehydrogenase/diacetyl reductase
MTISDWGAIVAPERRLDDQVAIVTGAGNGIGRAIARRLARAGAAVAICDRDGAAAQATADTIEAEGGSALGLTTDVTVRADAEAAVAAVVKRWGRLDVLVNNAGYARTVPFLDEDESWRTTFDVNVFGALLMTQSAAARMRQQEPNTATGCRGKIVNISSPAANHGRPLLAAYGASKAALNHLSKSSADVLGPELIATTVLTPGNVAEGMWRDIGPDLAGMEGRPIEQVVAERLTGVPIGRFQKPEETAELVLYVATLSGMTLNHRLVTTEPQVLEL